MNAIIELEGHLKHEHPFICGNTVIASQADRLMIIVLVSALKLILLNLSLVSARYIEERERQNHKNRLPLKWNF